MTLSARPSAPDRPDPTYPTGLHRTVSDHGAAHRDLSPVANGMAARRLRARTPPGRRGITSRQADAGRGLLGLVLGEPTRPGSTGSIGTQRGPPDERHPAQYLDAARRPLDGPLMPVQHESTTPAETAACRASTSPCPACQKRGGASIASGVIHRYGSEPSRGWVPRRLTDGTDATSPTFGVELETQRMVGRDRSSLTPDEAAGCAAPRGHWHPAEDGSVSGPEFASQPSTLAHWRSIAAPVGQFMRTLIHGGMRSHDGPQSCSMHVNIGADAFGDADHLGRFLRLVSVNPRWTTRLAQRTHEQMRSWASFHEYGNAEACTAWAVAFKRDGYASTSHSSVVNLGNPGRVEFRAPRGTLRLDRFMAKLEWVAAMVEFTRDGSRRPVPGAFTQWALASGEYREFVGLVADLMPGRIALATPAAASATSLLQTEA